MDSYIDQIVDDKNLILAEIYRVFQKSTNKSYIGQTLTHRLNKGRYRPYGYIRRLKSHQSSALCKPDGNHCPALMNAMRKYGVDDFDVELLIRCPTEEADRLEQEYIQKHNTVHPNGFNLNYGGRKGHKIVKTRDYEVCEEVDYVPMPRTTKKSEETRAKMSESVRKYMEDHQEKFDNLFQSMKDVRIDKKVAYFKDVKLKQPLEQYISMQTRLGIPCAVVKAGGKRTSFNSQFESYDESKQRALDFLTQVYMKQNPVATSSN